MNRLAGKTLLRVDRHVLQLTFFVFLTREPAAARESLIDLAIKLFFVGGVYGNQKPTEFLCLLLKLLQIQTEKEILVEYHQAEDFK